MKDFLDELDMEVRSIIPEKKASGETKQEEKKPAQVLQKPQMFQKKPVQSTVVPVVVKAPEGIKNEVQPLSR